MFSDDPDVGERAAADSYFHNARARFRACDFIGALEFAREGLLCDEDHGGLLQIYGLAAYLLGEIDDALEGLEGASLIAPLDPDARLALANIYARFGQRKSARATLKFLAEPGQCPEEMLPEVTRLLGQLGANRTALRICRRMIRSTPRCHAAHYGAAYYLSRLERAPARVLHHLRIAHKLAPNDVLYRFALANTLATISRPDEACELIRNAPATKISCATCLERLQGAAEDAGEIELAIRLRDRRRELANDCHKEGDRDCRGR